MGGDAFKEAFLDLCAGAIFFYEDQKPMRRPDSRVASPRDMPYSTDYIGLALTESAARLYDWCIREIRKALEGL